MVDERDKLLAAFQARREAVMRFLRRRVRSAEVAEDLTQETWIRLATRPAAADIANPDAYLFRTAANLAADYARVENRRLTDPEVDALLDIPAETPDPAEAAAGREALAELARALADLPERRRDIFRLARIHGVPHREIAARYGVSTRTVEKEILKAMDYCAARLQRPPRGASQATPRGRFGSDA